MCLGRKRKRGTMGGGRVGYRPRLVAVNPNGRGCNIQRFGGQRGGTEMQGQHCWWEGDKGEGASTGGGFRGPVNVAKISLGEKAWDRNV